MHPAQFLRSSYFIILSLFLSFFFSSFTFRFLSLILAPLAPAIATFCSFFLSSRFFVMLALTAL